jgi:hypothetical protein
MLHESNLDCIVRRQRRSQGRLGKKKVLVATNPQSPHTNQLTVAFFAMCRTAATVCWALSWFYPGLTGVVCTLLAITGTSTTLGIVRAGFRHKYHIRSSNYFADWMVSLLQWHQVMSQMRLYDDSVRALSSLR